jgi:two-component system, chemotaxis family, sensor kinase CheA
MNDEMEEIIREFITEAEESLDKIDPLFVELESKGYDREMLNDIFRSMHTLKGAAGFLGFQSIVGVAHHAENIMKKLREQEISLSRQVMNVILKSVDMLRLLIRHLKLKDGIEEDTSPLLKELEGTLIHAEDQGGESLSPPLSEGGNGTENSDTPAQGMPDIGLAPTLPSCPRDKDDRKEEATHSQSTIERDRSSNERKESLQTLRVDVERIDKVMNLTGEVVLVRNRLLNIMNYLETKYADDPHVESLFETVSFLDLVTSDMQIAVMKMRMQPIKKVFGKFPRLVRDIAASLGKEVDLKILGEDTEVDKSVMEQIGDPLVHIIRNAIDHGIESTEDRRRMGKPEKGTISISASQRGNHIVIEVSDDGKGIDVERVKKKAVEKALVSEEEAQRMTQDAAVNLVFLPGFSTADVASELSGRGVGMDVVKTNISKLNGYVEIDTHKNIGTTFKISIPLTLAIIQALMVKAGGAQYAIPLAPIEGTLKVEEKDIPDVTRQKVLVIRERVHPFFELSGILGGNGSRKREHQYAIVISAGESRFCLGVDELLGQEEVVIKGINGIDAASAHILGATITGDGRVVLILDVGSIARGVSGLIKKR